MGDELGKLPIKQNAQNQGQMTSLRGRIILSMFRKSDLQNLFQPSHSKGDNFSGFGRREVEANEIGTTATEIPFPWLYHSVHGGIMQKGVIRIIAAMTLLAIKPSRQ